MSHNNFRPPINIKRDTRYKNKINEEKIKFKSHVTNTILTKTINTNSLSEWIKEELNKITLDEFIFDFIMGFLQCDEIKSQEFGSQLKALIGDEAIPFIENLWELLLDALKNENGIPNIIFEKKMKEIANKTILNKEILKILSDSSTDDSSENSDYSEEILQNNEIKTKENKNKEIKKKKHKKKIKDLSSYSSSEEIKSKHRHHHSRIKKHSKHKHHKKH